MARNDPTWRDKKREEYFYNSTPKRVLYALARDYAEQVNEACGIEDDTTALIVCIAEMVDRIEILRLNKLI